MPENARGTEECRYKKVFRSYEKIWLPSYRKDTRIPLEWHYNGTGILPEYHRNALEWD